MFGMETWSHPDANAIERLSRPVISKAHVERASVQTLARCAAVFGTWFAFVHVEEAGAVFPSLLVPVALMLLLQLCFSRRQALIVVALIIISATATLLSAQPWIFWPCALVAVTWAIVPFVTYCVKPELEDSELTKFAMMLDRIGEGRPHPAYEGKLSRPGMRDGEDGTPKNEST